MRAAVLALVLAACSGSAVQQQARVAHEAARAFNTVLLPSLEQGFELEQRQALDRDCPEHCSTETASAAVAPVRASWDPIWIQVEGVRRDHDTWRVELEVCRGSDAGECMPRLDALARRLMGRLTELRCTLRASGRARLDTLPGVPACEVRDGG